MAYIYVEAQYIRRSRAARTKKKKEEKKRAIGVLAGIKKSEKRLRLCDMFLRCGFSDVLAPHKISPPRSPRRGIRLCDSEISSLVDGDLT